MVALLLGAWWVSKRNYFDIMILIFDIKTVTILLIKYIGTVMGVGGGTSKTTQTSLLTVNTSS